MAIGWTGHVAEQSLFLSQGNLVSCLTQGHQCPESFHFSFLLLSFFQGDIPAEKRDNRLMDFLLSTVCLEPSYPGSFYAGVLPK